MKTAEDRKMKELARLKAGAEARRSKVAFTGDDEVTDLLADAVRMVSIAKLKPNPINAQYFESLDGEDLARLAADIRKNGILDPLVAMRDGTLLTGHNRLEIARSIGLDEVPVRFVTRALTQDEQRERIIADNLHRRHLSEGQKRKLIAEFVRLAPEKSDRQISVLVKASPTTVGRVRKKLEVQGDVSKMDTSVDTKGRIQPRIRKAATVQVGQFKVKKPSIDVVAGTKVGDVSRLDTSIDNSGLTTVLVGLIGQVSSRLGKDDPREIAADLVRMLRNEGLIG